VSNFTLARIGGYTVNFCDAPFAWRDGTSYWEVFTPRGRLLSFPTAQMALDWIRWDAFNAHPPVRASLEEQVGKFFVDKYRTQMRNGAPISADLNMKKQGVPRLLRLRIQEGGLR